MGLTRQQIISRLEMSDKENEQSQGAMGGEDPEQEAEPKIEANNDLDDDAKFRPHDIKQPRVDIEMRKLELAHELELQKLKLESEKQQREYGKQQREYEKQQREYEKQQRKIGMKLESEQRQRELESNRKYEAEDREKKRLHEIEIKKLELEAMSKHPPSAESKKENASGPVPP